VALGIAATGAGEDLLMASDQLVEVAAAALAGGLVAGAFEPSRMVADRSGCAPPHLSPLSPTR
jgi:hypothetical protein